MKNPFRRTSEPDEAPEALHYSTGKPGVDQIPVEALMAWGNVFSYGERKYARDNWLKGTDWHQFYGSALRHLYRWWGGEDIDPESGLPHLAHAMWNVGALFTYQARGLGRDSRRFNQGGLANHGATYSYLPASEPMLGAELLAAFGPNGEYDRAMRGLVEDPPTGLGGVEASSFDERGEGSGPSASTDYGPGDGDEGVAAGVQGPEPVESQEPVPAWGCYCDMAPGPHPPHLMRMNFEDPQDLGDHLYVFNQDGTTDWVPV